MAGEISREIVRAHAEYYGRGPTKARTVWQGEIVLVLLEEVFTRAEMTLVGAGHFEQVRSTRQALHDEVGPVLQKLIETATGHRVRNFLSQVDRDGVASEVFVLDFLNKP